MRNTMKISNTAAKHITDFFINSGTISNDDRASYIYCFEYAIDTIIFPLTILLSGLIFNRFISALLFAVIIIPLKMSAGGAHASTRIMCSILSYSLYFVTLFCYQLFGNMVELASSDELFAHPLHPIWKSWPLWMANIRRWRTMPPGKLCCSATVSRSAIWWTITV